MTVFVTLGASAWVAHVARRLERHKARHRQMAGERGLGAEEIEKLEHLALLLDDTTLSDLLLSPVHYSRAVEHYVETLRESSDTNSAQYYGLILELTRLRRRVHPPGNMLRFIHSTRELPEGEDVTLCVEGHGIQRRGVTWAVNEDHIDIRLPDRLSARGFKAGTPLTLTLSRSGQGLYHFRTIVRSVASTDKQPSLRIDHSLELAIETQREQVRADEPLDVWIQPETDTQRMRVALTTLSGGGLSFHLAQPLPTDLRVDIWLTLDDPENPEFQATARVLRRETHDTDWEIHCRWETLAEEHREAIKRHVLAIQHGQIRTVQAAKYIPDLDFSKNKYNPG